MADQESPKGPAAPITLPPAGLRAGVGALGRRSGGGGRRVAVVREGLANAARHAHASSVSVKVCVTGTGPTGTVRVEVRDDGLGLPAVRDRRSGTGNLATRARQHGGTFSLGAAPEGPGTLLSWEVPLG